MLSSFARLDLVAVDSDEGLRRGLVAKGDEEERRSSGLLLLRRTGLVTREDLAGVV